MHETRFDHRRREYYLSWSHLLAHCTADTAHLMRRFIDTERLLTSTPLDTLSTCMQ